MAATSSIQYTDAHRAFVQTILKHRVMTEAETKTVHQNVCIKYNQNPNHFKQFLKMINQELENLQMAIRRSIQENPNEDSHCYVLVNYLNNEMTRLYSSFTKAELEFMKNLITHLVEDGKVRETTILNSSKMGVTDAENLLERLKKERWILQCDGYVSIGALTVCELSSYLEKNYSAEIFKCHFCSETSFLGHRCSECGTGGHRSCLGRYWTTRKDKQQSCPMKGCNATFDTTDGPRKRTRTQDDDSDSD